MPPTTAIAAVDLYRQKANSAGLMFEDHEIVSEKSEMLCV